MFRNDPWHFKDLHTAFITLFRMSTFEDWTDVMYINQHGCNKYGYSASKSCAQNLKPQATVQWCTASCL